MVKCRLLFYSNNCFEGIGSFLIPGFVSQDVPSVLFALVIPLVSTDNLCMYKYLFVHVCACVRAYICKH